MATKRMEEHMRGEVEMETYFILKYKLFNEEMSTYFD